MRMTPEVVVLGEHTIALAREAVTAETERVEALRTSTPALAELMARNGWTSRMIAWGHVIERGLSALGET